MKGPSVPSSGFVDSGVQLLKRFFIEEERLFHWLETTRPAGNDIILLGSVERDPESRIQDVKIVRASGPVGAILGWQAEPKGLLLSKLMGMVRLPGLAIIREVAERGQPEVINTLVRTTGRHIRVDLVSLGTKEHLGIYISDITEQRRKEKEMRARERAHGLLMRSLEVINASASAMDVVEGMCANLAERALADFVWIGCWDAKANELRVDATRGDDSDLRTILSSGALNPAMEALMQTCQSRDCAVVFGADAPDATLRPLLSEAERRGYRSVLADCIHTEEEKGILLLLSREPDTWSQIDMTVLRSLSASMARTLGAIAETQARKRGVQELQRSESRFRSLFEGAPVAYVSLDLGAAITGSNNACRKLLMIDVSNGRRNSFLEYVSPRNRDHFALLYEDLAIKGGGRTLELDMRKGNGTPLTAVVQLSIELDDKGTFKRSHCVLFDITERKEFEAALVTSEERLTRAFEIANDAIWDLDLRSGMMYFSHRYHAMLGYTPGEIPPDLDHWRALIHPEDYPLAYARMQEFLAGSALEFSNEHRMRTRQGAWLWILCRGRAVEFGENGRKLRVLGTNSDVTKRRTAEEALHETAQRYRGYIQASPLAILSLEADGGVLEANPAAVQLFEASAEELRGAGFISHIEEGSGDAARRILRQISLGGRGEGELRCKRRNGTVAYLQVVGSTVSPGTHLLFFQDISSRRRAEKLLQAREAMLESVLHTAMDGFLVIDREGRLLESNESYGKLVGLSNRDLLRMRVSDLDAIESPESMLDHMVRIERAGSDRWETKHRCADGRLVDVEINATFLPNEGGRIVAFLQNITERKEAENALKQSRKRLSLIIDGSSLAAWDWDIKTDRVVCNAYWAQLLGYGAEELEIAGEEWRGLVHPEDRAEYTQAMQTHINGAVTHFSCEYRVRKKTGAWLWLEDKGQVILRDAAGKPMRATGTQRDVTSRRLAEARVRQQAALLDQTEDIVLACDSDGRLQYCNRSATENLAILESTLVGRLLSDILPDITPLPDKAFMNRVLGQGAWKGEMVFASGYRNGRIWDTRWLCIPGREGVANQVLVVCTDVSERRLLEARFLRAQRMESIGALASGVAHDLNNILLPITLAANMLRTETDEVQKKSLFAILDQSAQRGAEIVKQLLTFGRGLDGRRIELQPRMLLFEMRKLIRETFPKNIELECELGEDLWTIEADPTQMHQVLLNLCVNARDAMPNGGKLTLAGENVLFDEQYASMNPDTEPGPYIVLLVGDTGVGIPQENLEKLFDPFFTTKEPGKGTGLGLSTVHGIVKSHGGFVQVRSAPGQGAVFKVYLPAIPAPMPVQEESGEKHFARANGELVLVVDDEDAVRETLRHMLEAQGYRVMVAADGRQGMVCFVQQQAHIKAVITDIMMPVMDGAELIRAIRRLDPVLPVIAMSGLPEKEASAQKMEAKADHFLVKPFLSDQMLGLLSQCLHLSGSEGTHLEKLLQEAGIGGRHP